MAWDTGPAGYKFVRQSVYSLWLGTVGGGGLALLLNLQKVIVLSHVRVMETIAKKDSRTQYSVAHMPYTPLCHSLTTGANTGHKMPRLPQVLLWIFFIQWVTVPRREKWLEYP